MFTKRNREEREAKAKGMICWINEMADKYPGVVGCKCKYASMSLEAKLMYAAITFAVSALLSIVMSFMLELAPDRGLLSVLAVVGTLIGFVVFVYSAVFMFVYSFRLMQLPSGPLEYGYSVMDLHWLGKLFDRVNLDVEEYLAGR